MFVIVKSSRIYQGGIGYSGLSCELAGIEPGKIYRFFCDATTAAQKLQKINGIGWTIHNYIPFKHFEAKL